MDVADLRFSVDSSGFLDASRNMETMQKQAGETETATQRLVNQANAMGDTLQRVGGSMTTKLTLPLAAAGGAALKMAIDVGSMADRLLDLQDITGLSTDRLQEFSHVSTVAGVNQDLLAKAAQSLSRRLPDLASGTGRASEFMDQLGLNVLEADGSLRSMDSLMPDIVAKLADMENETERNAIATQLLGRAGSELAPILAMGSDEIERLGRSAHETGRVLSQDALVAANKFRTEWDLMREQTKLARMELGMSFIPVMTQFVQFLSNSVIPTLQRLTEGWANLSPETQRVVFGVGAAVAAIGPLLVVMGTMIKLLGSAAVAARTFWVAITGPVGVLVALAAAVVAVAVELERRFVPGMEEVSRGAQAFNILTRAMVILRETALGVGEVMLGLGVTVVGAFRTIIAPIEGIVNTTANAIQALRDRDIAGARQAVAGIGADMAEAAGRAQAQVERGMGFIGESISTRVENAVRETTRLQGALLETGDSAEAAGRSTLGMGSALQMAMEPMNRFSVAAEGAAEQVGSVTSGAQELIESLENQLQSLNMQEIQLQGGTRALLQYELAQAAASGASAEQVAILNRLIDEIDEAERRVDSLSDAQQKGALSAGDATAAFEDQRDALIRQIVEARGCEDALRDLAREQFVLEQITRLGADATEEQVEEIRRLAEAAFDAKNELKDLADSADTAGGAAGRMSTALQNAVFDGMDTGFQRFVNNLSDRDFDDMLSGNFGRVGRKMGQSIMISVGESLGQTAGTALGNMAGGAIGNALGTTIGGLAGKAIGSLGGPIGAALGGMIGSALFGDKKAKFQVGGDTGFASTGGTARESIETELGQVLFRFRNVDDAAANQVRQGISQFDDMMASLLEPAGLLGEAQGALRGFAHDSADEGDLNALLTRRFRSVLGVFDTFTQSMVRQVSGLEAQAERLADMVAIKQFVEESSLLTEIGFENVTRGLIAMQEAGETLGDTFNRVMGGMQRYAELAGSMEMELLTMGLTDFQQEMINAKIQFDARVEALHREAQAAGLAATRGEDLANAHELYSLRVAAAVARLEESARGVVESLFGSELTRLQERIAEAERRGKSEDEIAALRAREEKLREAEADRRRLMEAQNLAQMMADIASGTGDAFDVIAERLGFDLGELAEVLGVGDDKLTDLLESMMVDTDRVANEIVEMTDRIVGELVLLPGAFADALTGNGNGSGPGDDQNGAGGAVGGPGDDTGDKIAGAITDGTTGTTQEVAALRTDLAGLLSGQQALTGDVAAALQALATAVARQAEAQSQRGTRTAGSIS